MLNDYKGLNDTERLNKIREYVYERAESNIRYMFEQLECLYKMEVNDDEVSIMEIADAPAEKLPLYINADSEIIREYVKLRLKNTKTPGRGLFLSEDFYDIAHEDMRERLAIESDEFFEKSMEELSTLCDIADRLGDEKLSNMCQQFYFDY